MEVIYRSKIVIPFAVAAGAAYVVYKLFKADRRQPVWKFRQKSDRDIWIISSEEDWEEFYPCLMDRCRIIKVVGFDCEWVFWGKRLPVALIQIATYDGFCLLVRVFKMKKIPQTLKQFMEDKSILKVGVAVRDDGRKLAKDYGIQVAGCVDLRFIVLRTPGLRTGMSLAGIGKSIVGVTMVKDTEIRCGDWEAKCLSEPQVQYAADDALIAVDAFLQLIAIKFEGAKFKSNYYGSNVYIDEEAFWKKARSLCQGIIDMPYKFRSAQMYQDSSDEEGEDQELSAQASGGKAKPIRSQSKKAFMTRKRPLYYNCQLLAPDGECLTLCDIRKAEWYISKGLGVKVSEDPFTVQLKFEPKNRPSSKRDYYLQEKENVCVVCGAVEEYVRKLVVPQEYRKYFPPILKDHSSHDVLLLCINCHLKCADYEASLRQRLVIECGAPLDSGKDSKRHLDQDLAKVVSAAKALKKSRSQIPESRVRELEFIVKNFYGVQNITEELLDDALDMEIRVQNKRWIPHGKKVVEFYMQKEGGLLGFEKMWRKHFVEYMEPKFLPALWSIEHEPEKMQQMDLNGYGEGGDSSDEDEDDEGY